MKRNDVIIDILCIACAILLNIIITDTRYEIIIWIFAMIILSMQTIGIYTVIKIISNKKEKNT